MPSRIELIRGDITRIRCGAVVNAANRSLLGGGGVDGAIHRAAGPSLQEYCRKLPEIEPGIRCRTGEAVATPSFGLSCDIIIHTVGPVWQGGGRGEEELLERCYLSCLGIARINGIESVAFPAISCGAYGFPLDLASAIAVRTCMGFLARSEAPDKVILTAFTRDAFSSLESSLSAYGTV